MSSSALRPFDDVCIDVSSHGGKVPTAAYSARGAFPVIDQGKDEVAGWCDEEHLLFRDPPYILFGDHTRAFKFIEQPFVAGADGVKVLQAHEGWEPKYVYYALTHHRFPEKVSYERNFKHLRRALVPFRTLAEQRRIAALLDQADGIRRKRREAIVLAESFLRSAFLEMFGDPVGNPRGWEVKALGACVVLNPTAPKELRTNPDEQVSFVSMAAASELPRQPKYAIGLAADYLKGYTYFAKGDVLMAKITPCMENGKGAFLYDMPTQHGFGSTEFHVIRPNDRVLGEYLYHLLHSSEFRSAAASNMTGTAGQRRVPTAYLERFALPLPPTALQQRFADLVRAQSVMVGRLELAAEEAERMFAGLVAEVFGKEWP